MPNLSGQRVDYFDPESDSFFASGESAGQRTVVITSDGGFGVSDHRPFHTGRSLSSLLNGLQSRRNLHPRRSPESVSQEERDRINLNLETITSQFSDQTINESYGFENGTNKCPLCNSVMRFIDHALNIRECMDEICDFRIYGTSINDTFRTNNGEMAIRDSDGTLRVVIGRL